MKAIGNLPNKRLIIFTNTDNESIRTDNLKKLTSIRNNIRFVLLLSGLIFRNKLVINTPTAKPFLITRKPAIMALPAARRVL